MCLSSCKTSKEVKDGTTAYNAKMYHLATEMLPKEISALKTADERLQKTILVAKAYRENNEPEKALEWYNKAIDLKDNHELMMDKALMLKKCERYEEAMAIYEEIAKSDVDLEPEARRQAKACLDAVHWKKEPNLITVNEIEQINSPQSDYAPVLIKDGSLVFTSSRTDSKGEVIYAWTGEKYGDLYMATKGGQVFNTLQALSDVLDTKYYEGTCTFNAAGNEIYFTRCGSDGEKDDYCHIMYSTFDGTNWAEPTEVSLLSDTCNVGQPWLSKDGKTLFFSSDFAGGFGGRDIYLAKKTAEGWGEVSNLGTWVNTEADEMYPSTDAMNTLYFSSNGHSGMGGLDIFKATPKDKTWGNVENLKAPINSGADDFAIVWDKLKPVNADDPILKSGYFSSSRKGGKGGDDIYRVEFGWMNTYSMTVHVVEKKYENPEDTKSKVLGMQPVPDAKIDVVKFARDQKFSDTLGLAKFWLEKESDYRITVNKQNYFVKSGTASTKGMKDPNRVELTQDVTIEIEKIPTVDITISNIYYDYDKATLRPESFPSLDTLVMLVKENPDMTMEIGSHTDSRGSDEYNLKLSQARAQSVVDYLINKGIEKERLIAKGYGETKPVNKCVNGVPCTEEEYQANRRTTFRIVSQKINLSSDPGEHVPNDDSPKKQP